MNLQKRSSFLVLGISLLFLVDICVCEVTQLQKDQFDDFVNTNELVLVLFKASGECPSCGKALEYFDRLPQPDLVQTEIQKRYMVDDGIAERLGALNYPTIVFFRKSYPALYNGELGSTDDVPELMEWLTAASKIATQDLYEDSFEHLTQASTGATTGDWFVLFFKPGCEECMRALPGVESAAISLKHRMNFAKVDVVSNKKLAERFKITTCPYGILFKQGKMYPYEPAKFDAQSLISFAETWYKNVKASPVPKEPTAFDLLTESIALFIKEQVNSPDKSLTLMASVATVGVIIVIIVCMFRKPKDSRKKGE